jgi:RNA polymerase sigma-70 factor (ECF subfamily)
MSANVNSNISNAILAEIPRMRAYARLMTNDRSKADLAVEETLKSIVANDIRLRGTPEPRVPLFEILRGILAFDQRAAPRQDGPLKYISLYEAMASANRTANERQTVADACSALLKLNFDDREALILSAAAGFPDLDIAEISGCKQEVVRGRVLRGRSRLAALLSIEFDDALDPVTNQGPMPVTATA